MQDFENIAAQYGRVARHYAHYPALLGDGVALSHGQFWRVVNGLARHMAGDGVGSGSLVALNSRNMVVVLTTLMATALLGAGFVVAGPILARAKVVTPTHFYRTPEMAGHSAVNFRMMPPEWLRCSSECCSDM